VLSNIPAGQGIPKNMLESGELDDLTERCIRYLITEIFDFFGICDSDNVYEGGWRL
jgi:hypothetical protein